jgi:hypothetical protein
MKLQTEGKHTLYIYLIWKGVVKISKKVEMINPNETNTVGDHQKEDYSVNIAYLTRGQIIGDNILFTGKSKLEGRKLIIKQLGNPAYTATVRSASHAPGPLRRRAGLQDQRG